jgi:hypothetical protein
MTKLNKSKEVQRQLPTANAEPLQSKPLAIGETLYFTAEQVRRGEVDLSPLHAHVPASLVVSLLASLPVVVNQDTTTTATEQSASSTILKGA